MGGQLVRPCYLLTAAYLFSMSDHWFLLEAHMAFSLPPIRGPPGHPWEGNVVPATARICAVHNSPCTRMQGWVSHSVLPVPEKRSGQGLPLSQGAPACPVPTNGQGLTPLKPYLSAAKKRQLKGRSPQGCGREQRPASNPSSSPSLAPSAAVMRHCT